MNLRPACFTYRVLSQPEIWSETICVFVYVCVCKRLTTNAIKSREKEEPIFIAGGGIN